MGQLWSVLEPFVDVAGVILGLIGLIGTTVTFIRQHSPVLLRLRGVFIAILSIAVIVVAGFGLGQVLLHPAPPPEFPNAAKIQTLRVNLSVGTQDIASFDPAFADDTANYAVDSLIFPSLVMLDDHLQVEPWAASSYSISPDGRTYVFNLRPGLKWSDGSPINAYSFANALNRTLSPCTQAPLARYLFGLRDALAFHSQTCANGVISAAPGQPLILSLTNDPLGDSIVVPNDLTVELNLSVAVPYFLDVLTYPCAYAVPDAALVSDDWAQSLLEHGSFGGNLFLLSQHGAGTVTLQRNPAFWGAKPQLRTIVLDVSGSGTVDGKADDIGVCPSITGTGCVSVPSLAITYIGLNWSVPPLDDVRMRQALALALDKTQFYDPAYGTATNHIVPDGMPSYSNPSLTGPDGTTSLTGDLAQAKQLAAAYAVAKCGSRLSSCASITLSYPSGGFTVAQTAQTLWQEAFPGLQVNLAESNVDVYTTHTLQAWVNTWDADYPDPQDFLSLLFLPEEYNLNDVDRTANAPVYDLLRQADVELDPTVRTFDYQQAEQTLADQVAWISLVQLNNLYTKPSYVANYRITATGQVSLDTWQSVYILKH